MYETHCVTDTKEVQCPLRVVKIDPNPLLPPWLEDDLLFIVKSRELAVAVQEAPGEIVPPNQAAHIRPFPPNSAVGDSNSRPVSIHFHLPVAAALRYALGTQNLGEAVESLMVFRIGDTVGINIRHRTAVLREEKMLVCCVGVKCQTKGIM